MFETEPTPQPPAAPGLTMEGTDAPVRAELQKSLGAGASWFYWVAGLSLVNMILVRLGSSIVLIFGLGVTLFVDNVANEIGGVGHAIGIVFDFIAAGILALFGYAGQKGKIWPFAVGIVFYLIDGVITLLFQDYLGAAFHLYVLYHLFRGFQASRQLQALEAARPLAERIHP